MWGRGGRVVPWLCQAVAVAMVALCLSLPASADKCEACKQYACGQTLRWPIWSEFTSAGVPASVGVSLPSEAGVGLSSAERAEVERKVQTLQVNGCYADFEGSRVQFEPFACPTHVVCEAVGLCTAGTTCPSFVKEGAPSHAARATAKNEVDSFLSRMQLTSGSGDPMEAGLEVKRLLESEVASCKSDFEQLVEDLNGENDKISTLTTEIRETLESTEITRLRQEVQGLRDEVTSRVRVLKETTLVKSTVDDGDYCVCPRSDGRKALEEAPPGDRDNTEHEGPRAFVPPSIHVDYLSIPEPPCLDQADVCEAGCGTVTYDPIHDLRGRLNSLAVLIEQIRRAKASCENGIRQIALVLQEAQVHTALLSQNKAEAARKTEQVRLGAMAEMEKLKGIIQVSSEEAYSVEAMMSAAFSDVLDCFSNPMTCPSPEGKTTSGLMSMLEIGDSDADEDGDTEIQARQDTALESALQPHGPPVRSVSSFMQEFAKSSSKAKSSCDLCKMFVCTYVNIWPFLQSSQADSRADLVVFDTSFDEEKVKLFDPRLNESMFKWFGIDGDDALLVEGMQRRAAGSDAILPNYVIYGCMDGGRGMFDSFRCPVQEVCARLHEESGSGYCPTCKGGKEISSGPFKKHRSRIPGLSGVQTTWSSLSMDASAKRRKLKWVYTNILVPMQQKLNNQRSAFESDLPHMERVNSAQRGDLDAILGEIAALAKEEKSLMKEKKSSGSIDESIIQRQNDLQAELNRLRDEYVNVQTQTSRAEGMYLCLESRMIDGKKCYCLRSEPRDETDVSAKKRVGSKRVKRKSKKSPKSTDAVGSMVAPTIRRCTFKRETLDERKNRIQESIASACGEIVHSDKACKGDTSVFDENSNISPTTMYYQPERDYARCLALQRDDIEKAIVKAKEHKKKLKSSIQWLNAEIEASKLEAREMTQSLGAYIEELEGQIDSIRSKLGASTLKLGTLTRRFEAHTEDRVSELRQCFEKAKAAYVGTLPTSSTAGR